MAHVPLITVSPEARDRIDAVRQANSFPNAVLRLRVAGRRGARFDYQIALEDPSAATSADLVLALGGLTIAVDAESAQHLDGAAVVLDRSGAGGGLGIDNPNEGWRDPVATAVQDVIDRQVNPGIRAHRGFVTLLEVRDGTAYIEMGGGCQGCAQVDVTLREGIEVAIRREVPEITGVVDTTDHAAGTNPYFQASKK
ncbi:MAG: NifU family protein [Candidatus Limnocylindria bacterium]